MSVSKRAVRILQVPQTIVKTKREAFLNEVRLSVENERPRFVLDCSNLVSLDVATIQLLLSCLEEAMKCNGDVRLAALTPYAEATLGRIGVSRLFETYKTVELATQSYHRASTQTLNGRRKLEEHSKVNAA